MIVQDTMQYLSQLDPEVGASVQEEFARQQRNIELIASENIVSPAVMVAMGTCLTNKYAEGYPGHRYYGGCQFVDQVEQIAIDRACKLFGAKYANVQPHSAHRPTWLSTLHCWTWAIPSWAWTFLRAAI